MGRAPALALSCPATLGIAPGDLGIPAGLLTPGVRNHILPLGFAVRKDDADWKSWGCPGIPEELIACNYGKISEAQAAGGVRAWKRSSREPRP